MRSAPAIAHALEDADQLGKMALHRERAAMLARPPRQFRVVPRIVEASHDSVGKTGGGRRRTPARDGR